MYPMLCLLMLGSTPVETITPADVYVRVRQVRAELELIRSEMGRPVYQGWNPTISNAMPRQVYFQARTMFEKTNQLCFELVRERGQPLKEPGGLIQPALVLDVVTATLERLKVIKAGLGIPEQVELPPRDPSKQPSDVILEIMHANRQINMLMDLGFSPGNVYREVTMSVHYAARLLALYPGVERLPAEPTMVRGKQPQDVYERLLDCFSLASALSKQGHLEPLTLEVSPAGIERVIPSDVYDLAILIQAELAYLHGQTHGVRPPRDSFYPGRKFPAHVYQRTELLMEQLQTLTQADRQRPNRLGRAYVP